MCCILQLLVLQKYVKFVLFDDNSFFLTICTILMLAEATKKFALRL